MWDQTVIVMPMEQKTTEFVDVVVITKIVCTNYVWISVLMLDEVVKAVVIRGGVVHSPDQHNTKVNSQVYLIYLTWVSTDAQTKS